MIEPYMKYNEKQSIIQETKSEIALQLMEFEKKNNEKIKKDLAPIIR